MNSDVGGLTSADITKSSPPLTPSSSSRSAAAAVMKHDVGPCLPPPGYGVGVGYSAAAAAELGCRPFHSPTSSFGESMLDQLQVCRRPTDQLRL